MRRKVKHSSEWSVAIHEAGHVVMRYLLRLPIRSATIVPGKDYLGLVRTRPWPEAVQPEHGPPPRAWRRVADEVTAYLAGGVAQHVILGHRGWVTSQWDLSEAADLASYLTSTPEEVSAFLEWKRVAAHGILS